MAHQRRYSLNKYIDMNRKEYIHPQITTIRIQSSNAFADTFSVNPDIPRDPDAKMFCGFEDCEEED